MATTFKTATTRMSWGVIICALNILRLSGREDFLHFLVTHFPRHAGQQHLTPRGWPLTRRALLSERVVSAVPSDGQGHQEARDHVVGGNRGDGFDSLLFTEQGLEGLDDGAIDFHLAG